MSRKENVADPVNIADLFLVSAEQYGDREALKYRVGHHYESLTYGELRTEALKLAKSLQKLGLKLGDRAIIFSENRPEWVVCDLALVMLGCVNVPVHSVLSAVQLEVIIKEIKPKVLFFSDQNVDIKLLEIAKTVEGIEHLISFEDLKTDGFKKLRFFKQLVDESKLTGTEEQSMVKTAREISGDTVASIIYTSGTSGHMKGVKLTHNNFVFDTLGLMNWVDIYPEDKFLSILPLSHVFERTVGYYVALYSGASIGYSLDIASVSQEMKERKPNIIIAVPRLFEKIYERVMAKVNKNFMTKTLFRYAFQVKKEGNNETLNKLFDQYLFSKIRTEFGGEVRFFVSGGAALPPKIGKFFAILGLPILEGYGLTETSPVIATNRLEDYKFGTVGPVLDGVEVKICDGGEICVKGPNVSPGYIKDSDNVDNFKDGWFYTGDLGYFDRQGFLAISGRKKDLIVLTTGKKVSPGIVEEALESSIYVEQSFVFGEGRKHIGAVIVPNFEALKEKYPKMSLAKMLKDDKARKFLADDFLKSTNSLASVEKIRKFILAKEPFSIENGELTPKLSLRRHIIQARYQEEIESIYS